MTTWPRDVPLTYCIDCDKFVERPLLHVMRVHRDSVPTGCEKPLSASEHDHAIAVIYDWITHLSTT